MIKGTRQYDEKLPSISILIPAYNCSKYIEKTLQSIFAQKYGGRIEIVIGYDTKSTDDTLTKIENIYSPYDIIIDSDNDSSIGEGRNRLFKFATGDFVLFMDSDDLITNTLVQNAIELFTKVPELQVVSYKYKFVNESKSEQFYQSHCGVEHPKYEIMKSIDVMHAWWMSRKCTICAWGYIYRREFLKDVTFPNYSHGEDQIFVLRSMLKTDKVGFIDMIGYVYIIHESSVSHIKKTADEFWNEHKEYRDDYYKLTSDSCPSFYSIAYLDYLRWYVYDCAIKHDYNTFLEDINKKFIKHIPVVFGNSLQHTFASILFNVLPKKIFWRIARLRGKLVKI